MAVTSVPVWIERGIMVTLALLTTWTLSACGLRNRVPANDVTSIVLELGFRLDHPIELKPIAIDENRYEFCFETDDGARSTSCLRFRRGRPAAGPAEASDFRALDLDSGGTFRYRLAADGAVDDAGATLVGYLDLPDDEGPGGDRLVVEATVGDFAGLRDSTWSLSTLRTITG